MGQCRTERDETGQDGMGRNKTGQNRTGQDRIGRTRWDRTRRDGTRRDGTGRDRRDGTDGTGGTRRDEARRQGDGSERRDLPACFPLFLPHPSQPPPSLLATSSQRLGGYTRRVIDSPLRQRTPRDRRKRRRSGNVPTTRAAHLFLSFFFFFFLRFLLRTPCSSSFVSATGLSRSREKNAITKKTRDDGGSSLSVHFSLRTASVFFPCTLSPSFVLWFVLSSLCFPSLSLLRTRVAGSAHFLIRSCLFLARARATVFLARTHERRLVEAADTRS